MVEAVFGSEAIRKGLRVAEVAGREGLFNMLRAVAVGKNLWVEEAAGYS